MSVVNDPLWPQIAPFIILEVYDRDGSARKPRRRIELNARAMPPDLLAEAIKMQVPCCSCGQPVHPFRARASKSGRGRTGHFYMAVACDLSTNMGCSRGNKAREEYLRIEESLVSMGLSGSRKA